MKNSKTIRCAVYLVMLSSSAMFLTCVKTDQSVSVKKQNPGLIRTADLGNGYFQNPIFSGDFPDPSVLRDGDDYYMTHSAMEYSPGLLIWHSHDLVNWEPLCYALTEYLGSIYAPDLVKYGDTYYIYFPAVTSKGISNWVVTAKNPAGPWSKPIDLHIGQIDPGHVVGRDGKRYLFLSDGYIVRLADDGLSVIGGIIKVYNGWKYPQDWIVEGFCLESPKLIYHNGYYYLTVAEGGTAGPATSHMVVSARSKSVFGPWENSPYNPIVHTKSSNEKWWSKGHATIVSTADDEWWLMYHGYENGYYNLGRQTLLEPIEWTNDGWFKAKDRVEIEKPIRKPKGDAISRYLKLSDEFSENTLGLQWRFYRELDRHRFGFSKDGLFMNAEGSAPSDCSPMLCTPLDHNYEIETELKLEGDVTGGLVLFYNEKMYCGLGLNKNGLIKYERALPLLLDPKPVGNKIKLRIRNESHQVSYYYQIQGGGWKMYEASSEVSALNHNAFGGFLSLKAGLFSSGSGKVSFSYFKYRRI
jgi:beta-xylosidase